MQVGIRDLKNKLSAFLCRVERGEEIEVTKRGKVVARLVPVTSSNVPSELLSLVDEGRATWRGGKPEGATQPVPTRGRPLAQVVLDDRR